MPVEFRPPADQPVLRSRRVTTDAQLEAALADLRAGDEIRLVPGRTYSQGWWSVRKVGNGYATVRTDTVLPDRTVDTTDLRWMAKIATRGANEPAMRVDAGIRGVRFQGVGFIALPSVPDLNTLVFVGMKDGQETPTTVVPSEIVFDRVVMYAHGTLDLRRCLLVNAKRVALVRSTLWCHGRSSDAVAVGGWAGTEQLLVEGNRITGNGHGVLFGGNDAPDSTFMPRDLVIRGNRIYKPLAWHNVWPTKTLLEFKMVDGALIEGNEFSGHWQDAQSGFAILLKSTNQSGANTWAQTTNVTFRLNVIHSVANVFNLAAAPEKPARYASRMRIAQNLVYDVGPMFEHFNGRFIQATGPLSDIAFIENTFVHAGPGKPAAGMIAVDPDPGRPLATRFNIVSNIFDRGDTGFSSSVGNGSKALESFAGTSYLWLRNVLIGEPHWSDPPWTLKAPTVAALGFTNPSGADPAGFALGTTSPFRGTGADVPAVLRATAGARALR